MQTNHRTVHMNVPLELSFHHLQNTEALEQLVHEQAAHLEKIYARINSCRVAIEVPGHGPVENMGKARFRVRVDVTVPHKELVAVKDETHVEPHQDVYTGVRRAFRAVERQLKQYVRRIKTPQLAHAEPPIGTVEELYPEEDYGFLRTTDGQDLYFHANAVSGGHIRELEVGQEVHYSETLSEAGPKATRVRPYRRGEGPDDGEG